MTTIIKYVLCSKGVDQPVGTHRGRNAQIDPKHGNMVQPERLRADEGIGPYG